MYKSPLFINNYQSASRFRRPWHCVDSTYVRRSNGAIGKGHLWRIFKFLYWLWICKSLCFSIGNPFKSMDTIGLIANQVSCI